MKHPKTIYIGIIILFLIGINIYSLNTIIQNNKIYAKNISIISNENSALKWQLSLSMENSNIFLSPITKTVNSNREITHLDEIVNEPMLVLVYDENNCSSCVDYTSEVFKNSYNLYKHKIRFLKLVKFKKENGFITHLQTLHSEIPIYNLIEQLHLPIEDKNIPFICYLDENLICKKIIPYNIGKPEIMNELVLNLLESIPN
jgi:hypothetical protein